MSHSHRAGARHGRRLLAALAISVGVFVLELGAGILTNSLALVADSVHVFADVCGMALSLGAIRMASLPATGGRTFGLLRLEVVAAVANALLLFSVAGFVIWEGIQRLIAPEAIDAGPVVVVAIVAAGANLVALWMLRAGQAESLNIRGAYLEVFGDLVGSLGVLVAGIAALVFGIREADAVVSIAIGIFILPRTWSLLRDSVNVLLEATPRGVDMTAVRGHILEAPGVEDVHDLHAWTITSGMNVVSAHEVLQPDAQPGQVLDHLVMCLAKDFDIAHSTFQLETADHVLWEARQHEHSVLHR